jgi:hypothetical protein
MEDLFHEIRLLIGLAVKGKNKFPALGRMNASSRRKPLQSLAAPGFHAGSKADIVQCMGAEGRYPLVSGTSQVLEI